MTLLLQEHSTDAMGVQHQYWSHTVVLQVYITCTTVYSTDIWTTGRTAWELYSTGILQPGQIWKSTVPLLPPAPAPPLNLLSSCTGTGTNITNVLLLLLCKTTEATLYHNIVLLHVINHSTQFSSTISKALTFKVFILRWTSPKCSYFWTAGTRWPPPPPTTTRATNYTKFHLNLTLGILSLSSHYTLEISTIFNCHKIVNNFTLCILRQRWFGFT